MSETAALIEKAKNGFETLDVSVEHQIEALNYVLARLLYHVLTSLLPMLGLMVSQPVWLL